MQILSLLNRQRGLLGRIVRLGAAGRRHSYANRSEDRPQSTNGVSSIPSRPRTVSGPGEESSLQVFILRCELLASV